MQGKGSGAVNRVELECQVLCASLRQSWVRHDKVGAFTSIRELSHLFPDLLPPPEEERNGSNKANYYDELSVRPQSGLNSIVVGYLRTVRKFLMQNNPKDYRQQYNTILNAGFILRKPRLRLSHDLVVARRWLFESQMEDESTMETEALPDAAPPPATPAIQAAEPEPVQNNTANAPVHEQEATAPQVESQAASAPQTSANLEAEISAPAAAQTDAHDFLAAFQDNPAVKPTEFATQAPAPSPAAAAQTQAEAPSESVPAQPDTDDDEDYDPLAVIERSWQLARFTAENKKPNLDQPPAGTPPATPPVVAPFTDNNAPTQEVSRPPQVTQTAQSAAAQHGEPALQMQTANQAQMQMQQSSVTAPPAVQAEVPQTKAAEVPGVAQAAQPPQAEVNAATSPSQGPPARDQRQPNDNFVFDEKQLRKPEAAIDLPAVIRLLEAAHLITKVEVQALKAQMQLAPNISAEHLCINAGYVTQTELASLRLAENLLSSGKITMAQFQVAMYDERTSGLRMAESLQVRGWLDTEVRNSIEEFKKNNS